MDRNNNVPKLRFPEFSGEWEEKKLGKIANKVNRRNRALDVTRVLTNSANAGVVDQNEYFDRDIAIKGNTDNYHIVEQNEFVYNPRISATAPVGPISINKIGRGIMSPLYTVFRFHSGHIPFFEQYFQTTIWHPYLKNIANFGARFDRMNISTEGFFDMPIYLPSDIEEQRKIASCLSALDDIIVTETNKLAALKAHKKGLMQQLFPQNGETTPRLRFPGFKGEWKELFLGDSFDERTEKNRGDLPLLSLGDEGLVMQGDTKRKDNSNADKSKYLRVAVDDIAYNTMRMWQGRCVYANIEGIVSPAYTVCKPKEGIDSLFHYYLFKTKKMINLFHQNSQGLVSDTLNLKYEAFSKIKYYLPPSLEEQKKIASCLSEMDEIITAQGKLVEVLKSHKKGLMQQLFPQLDK